MSLDLDQFKIVNGTCGHLAEDEFGVLLQDCPLPVANRIAKNLKDAVEAPARWRRTPVAKRY